MLNYLWPNTVWHDLETFDKHHIMMRVGYALLTPVMVIGALLVSNAMYEARADGVLMVDETGKAVAAVVSELYSKFGATTILLADGAFCTLMREERTREAPPPADLGVSTKVELLW